VNIGSDSPIRAPIKESLTRYCFLPAFGILYTTSDDARSCIMKHHIEERPPPRSRVRNYINGRMGCEPDEEERSMT